MREEKNGFVPSAQQQAVIDFRDGDALVLAPPGSGKTDVLAYRIIKAHGQYGVPYEQMLCLTFTNRASREMQDRVRARIGGAKSGLFIGNLHRFCIKFLSENNLIPLDASIIDDDDQARIVREISNSEYPQYMIDQILQQANKERKKSLCFPAPLIDFHMEPWRYDRSFRLWNVVKEYLEYKRDNNHIDYDDIINLAYAAMMRPGFKGLKLSNYPWVQVDEIQDLNPLQLAIIDKLVDPWRHTAVYLGDERQSIFSFIGATVESLQQLKQRMRIFTFSTNYRSPKYLVDFINSYAIKNLGVDAAELPTASNDIPNNEGLVLLGVNDNGNEQEALIAAQARQLFYAFPGETIGILTRTNKNIDTIASLLDEHNIAYLKLSRKDQFKMVDYKTLCSHLAIVADEHRSAEWSRILYQTKTIEKHRAALAFVADLRNKGISMTDLLREDNSTYLQQWAKTFDNDEVVVFDTETTGLDIFHDDVIQIAALRLNKHGVVPGSEFEVTIITDREIPRFLSDGQENPMVAAYDRAVKMDFRQAVAAFVEYIGDSPVVAHNAPFDTRIIRNNARRRGAIDIAGLKAWDDCWDSLKIVRLVDPNLKSHKLGSLLEYYGIEEANTHLAIDDARATAALLIRCKKMMQPLLAEQAAAMAMPSLARVRQRLKARYGSYYQHTLKKLYSDEISEENNLIAELQWLYDNMLLDKYVKPIPRFEYIIGLFRKILVNQDDEPYFYQQLMGHIYEMRTFSESDLYHNGVVRESVHVMTVHKAKGLQFDSVFVHGLEDYPGFSKNSQDTLEESKRVLYVAISRARQRLYLCYNHCCSPFVTEEMQSQCIALSPQQIDRILELENVFKGLR